MAFDIPVQPLAAAIETYAAATGLQVLYNAHLVAGRRSTELVGVLTPQAALQVLLKGSGLVVRYAAPGALVIVAPPPAEDVVLNNRFADVGSVRNVLE
jgi:hypothetical protein